MNDYNPDRQVVAPKYLFSPLFEWEWSTLDNWYRYHQRWSHNCSNIAAPQMLQVTLFRIPSCIIFLFNQYHFPWVRLCWKIGFPVEFYDSSPISLVKMEIKPTWGAAALAQQQRKWKRLLTRMIHFLTLVADGRAAAVVVYQAAE